MPLLAGDPSRSISRWPAHPVTSAIAMLVAGVVSGIVWNRYFGTVVVALVIPVAAVTFRRSLRTRFGPRIAVLIACAAVGFALGCIRHERVCRRIAADDIRQWVATDQPRLLRIAGHLIARQDRLPLSPQDRPTSQSIVRTRAIAGQGDWVECSGDLLVQSLTDDLSQCEVGKAIVLIGWIEPVPDALNPGERSPRQFWNSRGVVAQADLRTRGILRPDTETPAIGWRIWREKVRAGARRVIRDSVSEPDVGLVESIVLGIRDNLSNPDRNAFRDSGTIHLLAISGLHLQAVALFVLVVCRRAGIRAEVASIGVVGFTCAYALVVTGGASVLRATVMALAMASSTVWQRPGEFRHRFVLAALVVLLVNPGDLFDAGAQLSFLGTVALVAASRKVAGFATDRGRYDVEIWRIFGLREASTGPGGRTAWAFAGWSLAVFVFRWMAAAVFVSTLVWAVTAPLVAFHFGAVNPVAILVNLPLVPLTSFALIAGLTGLAIAPLGLSWAAMPVLALSGRCMSICVGSLDWALRHGSGPWPVDSLTVFSVAGFYALGIACWVLPPPQKPSWLAGRIYHAIAPAFLIVTCMAMNLWYSRPPGFPEAEMLAVDHGLAVLVRWPDGRNWLYDCGRMGQPAVGRNIVAQALRYRGVHRLDAAFVSHADTDHFNGLESMIDAGIRVDRLVSSSRFLASRQPDARALIEALGRRGVPVESVAAGDILWSDAHGSARVLLPGPGAASSFDSDNAESLVIEIQAGGFRLLLTGDLEADGLRRFADLPGSHGLPILTAPHHGGLTSNPAWFYDAIRPRIVLSSQAKNRFGQATGLKAHIDEYCPGAWLYATASDGAIRLRWSADGLAVTGFAPGSRTIRTLSARAVPERGPVRPAEMVFDP